MFNWLRKKSPPALSASERESFEFGRKTADSMIAEYERRKNTRFNPVFDNYLNVLRVQLLAALDAKDAPPLTTGRIEYSIYLENCEELKQKMIDEISESMEDWFETVSVADPEIRTEFGKLIAKDAADSVLKLTTDGLQLLLDYTVPLEDADNAWRQANPELAVQFPKQ
jgi:hypothetical protein